MPSNFFWYDAMTTDRPYRTRLPEDIARKILSDASGTRLELAASKGL